MFFKSVFTEEYNYQMYAKHRNQAKNSGRKVVTDYEKPLSREVKSNPKVFFRYAKGKLNFKNAIPDLLDNGKILSDGNSKAKAFNMFFKSVLQRNTITKCMVNIEIKRKTLAEKRLQIMKSPCRER